MPVARLADLLEAEGVEYEVIHHKTDYTALQAAQDTETPGWEFAKTVVLEAGGESVLAVLPAPARIDREKLGAVVGKGVALLADESRMRELFPDCDVGAEPPFGTLYDLPVYVDTHLADDEYITFNAGTHEEAVRMRYSDFERLARPTVCAIVAD